MFAHLPTFDPLILSTDEASRHLPNYRPNRYLGDDLCSEVTDFTELDQVRIRQLYWFLTSLLEIVTEPMRESRAAGPELTHFLQNTDLEELVESIRLVGSDKIYEKFGGLARTAHDIRGGSLTSLISELSLALYRPDSEAVARSLFLLTRDHLKIMRNALLGLDSERREADLAPKMHRASLLVEKWDGAEIKLESGTIKVALRHAYYGPIAECCVEFGAIDRILYNLINNAARHTANQQIDLSILPLPDEADAENLRFVIVNAISESERSHLATRSQEGDLRYLFEAGVSTTGSGLGMSIVADFVCNAYGLGRLENALDEHYLGASLLENGFAAWFHWPVTHLA